MTAADVISLLELVPLPREGGYYRETYRSTVVHHDRSLCTVIYYLLTPETKSLLHRLKSDELWHFYQGDVVEQTLLYPDEDLEIIELGHNLPAGRQVQSLVPAGVWQGARLLPGGSWALMGCTVAPGFDFSDWELADRAQLLQHYSPDIMAAVSDLLP
jgi:uncharacterized protein